MKYTVGIVGLGLMGASLALALRGFKDACIMGADLDELVCRRAEHAGVVHKATTDTAQVMEQADLLVFCVYGRHIPGILKTHAKRLKPGSVVSDICGVKMPLYDAIMPLLPEDVVYIGMHPMAGKERDGFENAETKLYRNSGFLITPTEKSTPESIELVRELAGFIGATRLQVVEPAEHDKMIAYTSDLMHVAAVGLCVNPPDEVHPAFTAGAFRDCTRVANINAEAWTELIMDNRHNTADALEQYIADLQAMKKAMQEDDPDALREILQRGGDNKRGMLYK